MSSGTRLWHPFAAMGKVDGHELVLTRGEGSRVWDAAGNEYLDATAGLWYARQNRNAWLAFACDRHADDLIAPRELLPRDRDVLNRRRDGPAIVWPTRFTIHTSPQDQPVEARRCAELLVKGLAVRRNEVRDETDVHFRDLSFWLVQFAGGQSPPTESVAP